MRRFIWLGTPVPLVFAPHARSFPVSTHCIALHSLWLWFGLASWLVALSCATLQSIKRRLVPTPSLVALVAHKAPHRQPAHSRACLPCSTPTQEPKLQILPCLSRHHDVEDKIPATGGLVVCDCTPSVAVDPAAVALQQQQDSPSTKSATHPRLQPHHPRPNQRSCR